MIKKIIGAPQLLLFIAAFCWGGNAVASKFAVGHISPMMLTFSRWFIAVIFLSFIGRKVLLRDWPVMKQNGFYLLGMGVLGFSMFNGFLYSSAHFIPAINIAIEQAAIPLIIFVINLLLFKAPIRLFHIIGYSITALGVLIAISKGDIFNFNMGSFNFGDILMGCAGIVYALYTVLLRKKPDVHWLSLTTAFALGGLIGASFLLGGEIIADKAVYPLTLQGILVVIYTAAFPSIIAQACYIQGNAKLGANIAGLYVNLVPIMGVLLAVAVLGEQLHFYHAAALVLVIGGIFIAQRAEKK